MALAPNNKAKRKKEKRKRNNFMQLPNYAEFKSFIDLREKMQAFKDGVFELFDKNKHLTGEERRALENGLAMDLAQIVTMRDGTLRYKNSRVMIYTSSTPNIYHIADCELINKLRKDKHNQQQTKNQASAIDFLENAEQNQEQEQIQKQEQKPNRDNVYIFTSLDELFPNKEDLAKLIDKSNDFVELELNQGESQKTLRICKHCLQRLHYKGFDMYQNRKFAYSEELAENFSKANFYQEHKLYPLTKDLL